MSDDFDLNNDGKVTQEELDLRERMLEIENKDGKSDTQRKMAWIALWAIIGYAIVPLLPFIKDERLPVISSMSDTFFVALASVIGFFFGAQAYMSRK